MDEIRIEHSGDLTINEEIEGKIRNLINLLDGLSPPPKKTTLLPGGFSTKEGRLKYKTKGYVIEISEWCGFAHSEYSKRYTIYKRYIIIRKKEVFYARYSSASYTSPYYWVGTNKLNDEDWLNIKNQLRKEKQKWMQLKRK